MSVVAVVGGQYGDEGKGKFVHYLVHKEGITIVGRGNGGCNAGHNVYDPERGVALALHLMPSGVFGKETINVVGDGTVINPHNFVEEMDAVEAAGVVLTPENLKLSSRAHVTLQTHRLLDGATDKVGSTGQGIGPTYRDKIVRSGLRLEVFRRTDWRADIEAVLEAHNAELVMLGRKDLVVNISDEISRLSTSVSRISSYICDTVSYLCSESSKGTAMMLEGAQATMLDINHGTYPYVTSSSTTVGGIALGLGLPPQAIRRVIGVFKLPMTRVGKGPFTTLLSDKESDTHDKLAGVRGEKGAEFGATTGRARSIGWMDLVMAKYAHMMNGFTEIGLTKLDMLSGIKTLKVAVKYRLDGVEIDHMPADTVDIEKCLPVYIDMPGWDQDITGLTDFDKLPENAQKYVQFIEDYLSVRVSMIGTGPDNTDMIIR
jgi:adenylosuccinate synthase